MCPNSKFVYKIDGLVDFAISPDEKLIIAIDKYSAKIANIETREKVGRVFKFNGSKLWLP